MNCKPGDLAVYVGARLDCIGHICTVVKPDIFHAAWVIDPPLPRARCDRHAVWDRHLRPIRPQPDDAVDEVIQRIGTPHKETA